MTTRDLARLYRHYAALSPSSPALVPTPPFPSAVDLSRPETQQWFADHLLSNELANEAGARTWKKVFWRRVVASVEEGFARRHTAGDPVEDEEVHPDILEAMVDFLSGSGPASAPGICERTYYWGRLEMSPHEWNSVTTREEGRMISGGTTGLRTWQACISLSNHFVASREAVCRARNVVELGAGVGLLSLVSATLMRDANGDEGEGRIVATDVDEKVLELLDGNVRLNRLKGHVLTKKLDWELASDLAQNEGALTQWETDSFGPGQRADLVIGADIVYDPALAGHLASTLAWLLRARDRTTERAQAIVAGTIRNESTWELFLSECRTRELSVSQVTLEVPAEESGIVGAEGWEGEGEVRVVSIVAGAQP
ncbi:hypothetical protein JCM10212_006081 [Sporobolomyces blumeae]